VGQIIAVLFGYFLFRSGDMTLGTIVLLLAYTDALFRPLMQITRQLEGLQKASASIERILELLHTESAVVENPAAALPPGALSVSFDQVSFSYLEGEPVLQKVGFELRAGRVLGLLGRTGSGKTTISRLLLRLYDPDNGVIRFGGIDARNVGVSDLRQRVGMVTQSVQLFAGSVRDNLTLFNREVRDDFILEILKDLGLGGWYRKLPDGLDTHMKNDTSGISSGEAQLLAFARIFLRNPGLVILDEASAHLDPATESYIEHAVDRLLADRTGIVIAHRLSTVERADDIIVLEDGKIVEAGERRGLAANPQSRFSHLLETGLARPTA
jgi:ATP-binding cassette subfamily B protein